MCERDLLYMVKKKKARVLVVISSIQTSFMRLPWKLMGKGEVLVRYAIVHLRR